MDELEKIVAEYHYRDGIKHPDGSMGTIKISPKQLRIALDKAYVLGRLPGLLAKRLTGGAND